MNHLNGQGLETLDIPDFAQLRASVEIVTGKMK
jgi:hypothetical protein